MDSRRTPRTWSVLCLLLAVAGCRFDAPDFDGTRYACAAPSYSCPPGHACVDGWCTGPELGGEIDAGASATSTDAGPDASEPPGPPTSQTLRFGERPDADRRTVTADASLLSADATATTGGNGYLEIDADPAKVAVMRFDLSAIPTTATVVSASLEVVVFDPLEDGAFRLYPITEPWSEDTVSWNQRQAGTAWTAPGAGPGSSDRTRLLAEVAPRANEPITVALAPAIVQGWVTSPAQNRGFVWISTSPTGRGGQLRSSEYGTESERPLLRVVFQP